MNAKSEYSQYPIIFYSDLAQPALHRYDTDEEKFNSLEKAWPDRELRNKYLSIIANLDLKILRLQEFRDSVYQDTLINDRNLRWVHDTLEHTIKEYKDLVDSVEKTVKCQVVRCREAMLGFIGMKPEDFERKSDDSNKKTD